MALIYWRSSMKRRFALRSGFTLIEMLIALIIISILMAVSASAYSSAITNANKKKCRLNMQVIANAEDEYKMKNASNPRVYTTTLSDLISILPRISPCPSGGVYTITISDGTSIAQNGQIVPSEGLLVSCSASGHGKLALNVDTY